MLRVPVMIHASNLAAQHVADKRVEWNQFSLFAAGTVAQAREGPQGAQSVSEEQRRIALMVPVVELVLPRREQPRIGISHEGIELKFVRMAKSGQVVPNFRHRKLPRHLERPVSALGGVGQTTMLLQALRQGFAEK